MAFVVFCFSNLSRGLAFSGSERARRPSQALQRIYLSFCGNGGGRRWALQGDNGPCSRLWALLMWGPVCIFTHSLAPAAPGTGTPAPPPPLWELWRPHWHVPFGLTDSRKLSDSSLGFLPFLLLHSLRFPKAICSATLVAKPIFITKICLHFSVGQLKAGSERLCQAQPHRREGAALRIVLVPRLLRPVEYFQLPADAPQPPCCASASTGRG